MAYTMNTQYFTGSQASIFIGDVWVDEIVDLQFSLGANAAPIYGYGSTFYSHVASGRVLVQGSFTINFREPNYLFAILARYQSYNGNNNLMFEKDQQLKSQENPYNPEDLRLRERDYSDKRDALETFFNKRNTKTGEIEGPVYNSITGYGNLSSNEPGESNDFAIPTFDIKVGYGSVLDENTVGERIVGVKLVGKSRIIMSNGEPIKESYSFFARNLI